MKFIQHFTLSILIMTLLFTGTSCETKDETPFSLTNFYFDTAITITLYETDKDCDKAMLIQECFSQCKEYENLFSRTIEDSDISKINRAKGKPVTIHQDVAKMITDSIKYSKLSDGAYDITIAPLVSLWDINSGKKKIPAPKEIKTLLHYVDYQNIEIRENTIRLKDPNAQIDLGGIAKGYVADKLKNYLVSKGVTSAIIDLGGNVLTIGSKSASENFTVGIRKPFSEKTNDFSATIAVSDKSVVTSGTYQRYFEKDKKIYHHILNTKTGYPVQNTLSSVTIISDKSEEGDALSTTAFALGLEKGKALIECFDNIEAVFIDNEGNLTLTNGLMIDRQRQITFQGKKKSK